MLMSIVGHASTTTVLLLARVDAWNTILPDRIKLAHRLCTHCAVKDLVSIADLKTIAQVCIRNLCVLHNPAGT